MKRILAVGLLLCVAGGSARAETFTIDPAHSKVSFKVHGPMGIPVHGTFAKFTGEFSYEPNQLDKWSATATIDAASILTGIHARDSDLQSPRFLDAAKYPTIAYAAAEAVLKSPAIAEIRGNLTLHGVTHPVVLTVNTAKIEKTAAGVHAVAVAQIKRLDFGVGPNGGMMVGKTIKIVLDVQGVPKTAP